MIKLLRIESQTPDRRFHILYADTKTEVPQLGSNTLSNLTLETGSMLYTANGEVAFLKSDDTWSWAEETSSGGGGGSSPTPAQPSYGGYVVTRKSSLNGVNGLMSGAWVETWDMTSTGSRDFWNSNYNSPSKIWFNNGITTLTGFTCVNCSNLSYVYLANTITSIDQSCFGYSITKDNPVSDRDNLTVIEVEEGFNANLWLGDHNSVYAGPTHLTRSVINNIIANYANNSGKTLTLTPACFELLTNADISTAILKGLSIASSSGGTDK